MSGNRGTKGAIFYIMAGHHQGWGELSLSIVFDDGVFGGLSQQEKTLRLQKIEFIMQYPIWRVLSSSSTTFCILIHMQY